MGQLIIPKHTPLFVWQQNDGSLMWGYCEEILSVREWRTNTFQEITNYNHGPCKNIPVKLLDEYWLFQLPKKPDKYIQSVLVRKADCEYVE